MTKVKSITILLVVAWVTMSSCDSECTRDCVTTLSVAVLMLFTRGDRKSTRLNSSHLVISYAVFCLKKKISTNLEPVKRGQVGKTLACALFVGGPAPFCVMLTTVVFRPHPPDTSHHTFFGLKHLSTL